MPMLEADLIRLFQLLRRPIVWDPIPPWIRRSGEMESKFAEAQTRWNAKLTEIEQQKFAELAKIAGLETK